MKTKKMTDGPKGRRRIPGIFHPGSYLREELEARKWSQKELAKRSGINLAVLSGILCERTDINVKRALALEKALGTGAEMWMRLQVAYEIAKETQNVDKEK